MCVDNIAVENLDYCPTDEIAPGTSETDIYIAFKKDIDSIAEPPAMDVATSFEQAATISGTHAFSGGNGFFKVSILPDTGQVDSTGVGEKGAKSFQNSFSGTLPGTSKRNKGFARKAKNLAMIVLVKTATGEYVQLGSGKRGAFLETFDPSTGAKAEDVNGIPFVIQDIQPYCAPVYEGSITEFTP